MLGGRQSQCWKRRWTISSRLKRNEFSYLVNVRQWPCRHCPLHFVAVPEFETTSLANADWVRVYIYIRTHARTHTHTHTRAHAHAHTHTHTHRYNATQHNTSITYTQNFPPNFRRSVKKWKARRTSCQRYSTSPLRGLQRRFVTQLAVFIPCQRKGAEGLCMAPNDPLAGSTVTTMTSDGAWT